MSNWISVEISTVRVYLVQVEDDDSNPTATAVNIISNDVEGDFNIVGVSEPFTDEDDIKWYGCNVDKVIPIG